MNVQEKNLGARYIWGAKEPWIRRFGVPALAAVAFHAALALAWPEPVATTSGNGEIADEAPGYATLALEPMESADAPLIGEAVTASVRDSKPLQPEVVLMKPVPGAFTQDVAMAAPVFVATDTLLAAQLGQLSEQVLQALQDSLGNVGRGGKGFKFGTGGALYAPNPPYPPAARREGREGVVELLVLIDAQGRARRAEVSRSSGYEDFDQSARNTVMTRWKFPARENELQVVRVLFSLTATQRTAQANPTGERLVATRF